MTETLLVEATDDVQGHLLPLLVIGAGVLFAAGCETTNVTIINVNVNSPGSTQTNTNGGKGSAPPPK